MSVFTDKGIRAVLFDKDGTLLDFDSTWRPVADRLVEETVGMLGLGRRAAASVKDALGILEDGFAPDSVFVQGTAEAILSRALGVLELDPARARDVAARLRDCYMRSVLEGSFHSSLATGVVQLVTRLKACGYKVGIATADLAEATVRFLESSGLRDLIDFLGCDDGVTPPKPAADMAERMCGMLDLAPRQIAMVGDSLTDMKFARNAGLGCAVYLTSNYADPEAAAMADIVLSGVHEVGSLL
jgi:phosphoglycolate phosphatase